MKTKSKNKVELFRDNVAGLQYGDYQQIKKFQVGKQLKLTWEKCNKFDEMAIRVDYDGTKLGYIKKGENQDILHEYREANIKVECFITALNKNNPSWSMVTLKCVASRLLEETQDSNYYDFGDGQY